MNSFEANNLSPGVLPEGYAGVWGRSKVAHEENSS